MSSFASSSTLARQIEAGAPADLFISADRNGWITRQIKRPSIRQYAALLGNSTRWWSRRKPVPGGDNH
ncbi:substrate-binding domain-containing protein [Klebsiella pneumoniae]|uniref:substrate-binding domain-containing protein n=1 Tax=Klebsiella pneumoniae TaxID=573 RepID=UPI00391CAAAA